MAQYRIKTLYTTQGSREYYQDAESADEAATAFREQLIGSKDGQAKETIYMMTEDIIAVENNEEHRVDVSEIEAARRKTWEMQMNKIITASHKKLKDTMNFGVPDELPIVKS